MRLPLPTARWLLSAAVPLVLATGFGSARADDGLSGRDVAQRHFRAGLEAMQLDTPEARVRAYNEFKAAREAAPTVWKILGNFGQAADQLERDGEAIDALEEYLSKGAAAGTSGKRASLSSDLKRLRAGVATVTLEAPGTLWVVDTRLPGEGRPAVVNQYGPFEDRAELRVRAGKHEFKIEAEGAKLPVWAAELNPHDTVSQSFPGPSASPIAAETEPPIEASQADTVDEPTHTASYVLWGLGALGAGAATVLLIDASNVQDEAEAGYAEHCSVDRSQPACTEALGDNARAANRRTAALATGLGAVGALVAGTVLYFVDKGASGHADEARLQPWIGSHVAGVSGTF